jgi:ankyrin repeat protein
MERRLSSVVFAICAFVVGGATLNGAPGQSQSIGAQTASPPAAKQPAVKQQKPAPSNPNVADEDDQTPEDEDLSPAALQLDQSKASPLIQKLYQATRETKEKDILARLAEAKPLVATSDPKATDPQGRTALHWAIFGSSFSTKPKVIVAYEEIADALISRGVEINRQDAFQNTALDYLLYSPNFEIQTLLLENGATSGFLSAFYQYLSEASQSGASPQKPDLAPGALLDVRLDLPVYSDRSRIGDPVFGTVTYPLCKNGEQVACEDGELVIPPGTKINGTILFAQKAPDKYSQPRVVIDFSNIVHKNGQLSPLYVRLLDVDNAREAVRNNEIFGIVQPHVSSKVSLALGIASAANPIAGYTIKGAQTIYGLSIRREILFPAGTDVQVQVVRASMLKEKEPWVGWPRLPLDARLQRIVEAAPLRTTTPGKTPSDLTNLMFLGTEQQVIAAFGEAGWIEADNVNVRSALKAAQATFRQSGYSDAPVSTLLLQGRPPDIVLQKSLNTFAKRHHIRIWKLPETYNGHDVWVGAATHDIATTSSRAKTKWSHRIDPHVDRERDWVMTDLLFIGTAKGYVDVDRPNAPKKAENATGDAIVTDGKMSVIDVAGSRR